MMKKKYTVFVSSTYEDLKEERQEVMRVLLEADCIPCGMEYFPATEDSTLDFIKKIIDDCDYYVLILGNKYGSTDSSGQSYTEKEYLYAQEKGIPTLSFIRNNLNSLPLELCEDNTKKKKRLKQFRELAKKNKICKFWSNKDELARRVLQSISQIIKDAPGAGWVRADFPIEEAVAALDDYTASGIRRIHPRSLSVPSFEQVFTSSSCRRIRVLAFNAHSFTHAHKSELINLLSSGGDILFLLSNPNTLFIQQAAEMEGRRSSAIGDVLPSSLDIMKAIVKEADKRTKSKGTARGKFEIRYYDTELRNQMLICEDSEENYYAWMTVLTPPLAAVNCPMIEFSDSTRCVDYFNTIWDRHEKDSIIL